MPELPPRPFLVPDAAPAGFAPRPAVFFDRDGTLVEDAGYMHRPEQLVWRAGAREAIAIAKARAYAVFVVTNQSGIARGYFGPEGVLAFHAAMQEGCNHAIDGLAFCPHLPDAPVPAWAFACRCRKPGPGMIEALMRLWPVVPGQSLMIGDRDIDIEAASAAGIRGVIAPPEAPLDAVLRGVFDV